MKLVGILLMLLCAATQPLTFAQSLAQSVRDVQGTVLNSDGQPLANAVTFLQDSMTLLVRTFITEAVGHYRFGQLASDVDYQLWAEFKGRKSKTRAISSFDSKKQFNFDLKVDTPK
jgi:hypothetical protein